MARSDYVRSQQLAAGGDEEFAALIMAAMRLADTHNAEVLQAAFPDIWAELYARYHAPGGVLEADRVDAGELLVVEIPVGGSVHG